MTDAERSSAQAEEQDQTEGGLFSRIVETARNVAGSVADTAKDVVETVVERLPGVESSAEATADETATAAEGSQSDAGEVPADQATAGEQATEVPEVEPVAVSEALNTPVVDDTASENEPAADSAPVIASEAEVDADSAPVAAAEPTAATEETNGVVSDVVQNVTEAATTVGKRVARVYGTIAAAVQPAEQPAAVEPAGTDAAATLAAAEATAAPTAEAATAPTADAAEGADVSTADAADATGATYQPDADGGAKSGRPRRFKDVQPGMHLQGKVTSIALYGIFVDIGVARDGLVHISEMSDKRIESPTDLVEIGTPVDVWVKSVDPDARRISLTMRDPSKARAERTTERRSAPPRKREVNRERLAEMKAGDSVEGVISSLAPFGAFVDIGVGKDGLVHVSELAEGRIDRPEDAVQVGERYTFKVLEVDPDGNRISLSLRRAQRTQRMQQLETGVVMDGTISGIAPFGAFVDIGVGRDGLVHVSEISADRINSVEEVVKVGDKVQVKVIEVDPNSKRISLTMRVDEPLPNDRPRPAPRATTGQAAPFARDTSSSFTPAPSFSSGPSFGGPPPMEEGRGGDRRGGSRRAPTTREGSREGGGRVDFGRADARSSSGSTGRRDRNDRGGRPAGGRSEGGRGGRREGQPFETAEEVYTFEDPEEETFTGDATLEDLLSKFNSGKGRDRKQSRDEEDSDEGRAEAIRRTLALRDEE